MSKSKKKKDSLQKEEEKKKTELARIAWNKTLEEFAHYEIIPGVWRV